MTDNPNGKQKHTSNQDGEQREEENPIDALWILSRVTSATARLAGRSGASDISEELDHYAEQLGHYAEQLGLFADKIELGPRTKRTTKE